MGQIRSSHVRACVCLCILVSDQMYLSLVCVRTHSEYGTVGLPQKGRGGPATRVPVRS